MFTDRFFFEDAHFVSYPSSRLLLTAYCVLPSVYYPYEQPDVVPQLRHL